MKYLRKVIRSLPTLLTALIFATAVWIYAVTQADPTETRTYPRPLPMEIVGLDPSLTITNEIPGQVNLAIRAPSSIHSQLENDINLIDVILDLSGVESGVHTLTPQVNLNISPAEVVRIAPSSVFIKLDAIITESFPIDLRVIGNPTIGFEVQIPELSNETVLISGPKSLIDTIDHVNAEINIADASEDVQRMIELVPLDADEVPVTGVTLNPPAVQVTVPVTQRGGYRTVVVKIVTSGQIAAGYRLTNIFAMPPTVTIFSAEPGLVDTIPGFVETTPINLNMANEDIEIRVALNLPEGINVVGSQNVTVQIGIDPIQSSISFTNVPIQIEGLGEGLAVEFSPNTVDIFLSGPLPLLDELKLDLILVLLDLTDRGVGTYQLAPEVWLENNQISVDAILPSSIEVTITEAQETGP
ncbi:MAG: YbbR-like domain-containing protein [Brevefilum sp.]